MAEISPRRLRVAAVQMHCEPGASEHNLRRGAELVAQAVAQSAELVLLPELMPGGYSLTEANWDSAETMRGDSVAWLKAEAKRHSIYLGFSFLEADGDDFYNSFVLAEMGEEEGMVVAEARSIRLAEKPACRAATAACGRFPCHGMPSPGR